MPAGPSSGSHFAGDIQAGRIRCYTTPAHLHSQNLDEGECCHTEAEQEARWGMAGSVEGRLHKGLEGHCYCIAGEDLGMHCMGHFEEGHIERGWSVGDHRTDQGLVVHYLKKGLVAVVGIEGPLEESG